MAQPIRAADPGALSVALVTGRTDLRGARWRFGSGPGNRVMSRPKVGVLLDSDAFNVSREREGSRGGIQDHGGLRGGIPYRVGENYEHREKTTSPGMLRADGASEQVRGTRRTGGKFIKFWDSTPVSVTPEEAQNFTFSDLEKLLNIYSSCHLLVCLFIHS